MRKADFIIAYDPRGRIDAPRQAAAARVTTLAGRRLGILDNTKWNAGRLLRQTAARLDGQFGFAAANYYTKESFSKPAAAALIATIAAASDIVLTAIGD